VVRNFSLQYKHYLDDIYQQMSHSPPPIVLCFSGHDPTGGAGLHADIEAIAAAGAHAASAVTCLTVQDTHDVMQLNPTDHILFRQQALAVLNDLPVAAIKIGLIGSVDICREIVELIAKHSHLPVIFDPVLAAGGGSSLAGDELLACIRSDLLPLVFLATPNSEEARRLSGREHLADAASEILSMGCNNLLITGAHEKSDEVINTLYQGSVEKSQSLEWPRLPHNYHGSGCTLASAIAARISLGLPLPQAVSEAQKYTWNSLERANKFSSGQALPNRVL
jgi:hydroxymethylpyrimidine/phosphomethylpyrimidine kinase